MVVQPTSPTTSRAECGIAAAVGDRERSEHQQRAQWQDDDDEGDVG